MPFKPIAQLDFSGGANLVVNPYLISQKQAADIENLILDEHASLRTRDGVRLLTTSPDVTNPLVYRGILSKVNGQEFPFAIQAGGGSGVTVTLDTSGGSNFSAVSSKTVSATLGGSAAALVVGIAFESVGPNSVVSSIKYNGVNLTKIISDTNDTDADEVGAEMWILLDPDTSGAHNIVATFAGSAAGRLVWSSYIGVTSYSGAVSATGKSDDPSLEVASNADSLVVDLIVNTGTTMTVGPDQTEISQSSTGTDRVAVSTQPGDTVVEMEWTTASDVQWVHLGVSLNAQAYTLYDTTIEPWTIVDTVNTEPLPDVVYMSDEAIILHGYSTPLVYDGSTLTAITADVGQTVPPGAKHGIFHLGALWLWNTSTTTTSLDGPSSLRASSVNDHEDWPNANQIFISKDDGQEGMGMSQFTIVETGISPTATLVLFKNYSGYQVTGVFGASTFSVQPIKSDMGCIAPRTIQFVSGFGVIRLTHKGFALYNGVEDRLISEEMRPAIFGSDDFTGLDFTTISRSWASQSQNPPLYVAACPVNGTDLTRLFIYDLIRRGWTICTLPVPLSCMRLYFTRAQFPVIHAGTATGGQIITLFNNDKGDLITGTTPTDVEWSVKTRSFFAGNQMTPAYWRRAQLSFNIEPNKVISVTPIIDGGEREAQLFDVPGSAAASVNITISPDIMETAHTVQLLIEGAGHAHLRGLEFHASQKPSNKYLDRA